MTRRRITTALTALLLAPLALAALTIGGVVLADLAGLAIR